MNDCDTVRRFHFEDGRVRGQIARLDASLHEVLGQHHYPGQVAQLLGEALVAAVLMGSTLKFEGHLSLQARSRGPVALLFAESSDQHHIRGYVRVQAGAAPGPELTQLLRDGTLAITISPARGERHQGIVPLDAPGLGPCLEHYFAQSEQLPTVIRLACDGRRAAGLLLQSLPEGPTAPAADARWTHLGTLAETVRTTELLELPFETLLWRLFPGERLRLHAASAVAFGCSCSVERATGTLRAIGEQEARAALRAQDPIRIQCEFCQQEYLFGAAELERLFSAGEGAGATRH